MPTVLGINQVPANFQSPTMWDRFGGYLGRKEDKLEDALLALLTTGLYQGQRNIPNPSYGQPTGSPGSPGTSFQMAGQEANPLAPPMPPQVARKMYQAPQAAVQAPIFPPNQPNISLRDIQQAQAVQALQKSQRDMDVNSPLNQFLLGQAKQMNASAAQPAMPATSDAVIDSIAVKADAGDAQARAFMDYYLGSQ